MAILKDAITSVKGHRVEMQEDGFNYAYYDIILLGVVPLETRKIVFADITKIESEVGPSGNHFWFYKTVAGKDKTFFWFVAGRDAAVADRVASALVVLCPNLK